MPVILKIGQGYDLHRLTKGRQLILAGVNIPYEKGLAGHSDADVVMHAIIDAILGAAGLGDIGEHFPDTDPAYKGIDSSELLLHAYTKVQSAGFSVVNIDATIIAEKPRLSPYKLKMQQNVADLLKIKHNNVNIKAKTNEGLGPTGTGEAIVCIAIAGLGIKA